MPPRPFRIQSALCLLVALLATTAGGDSTWKPFVPEDGSFRVEMPGAPQQETRERWFPASRFVSTVYKVRREGDVFGVNHTDLPGAILFVTSDRYILDTTREGFLESSQATQLAFEASEVDGRPARELLYAIPATADNPAQKGTARLLFVDKRLFIFYAEIREQGGSEDDVLRYFSSIRIPAPD